MAEVLLEQLREALAPEFQLERELGSGGMGTVFLAREVALDRAVAIKVLRPEHASAGAVEQFQSEAQTLAKVRHPNIVTVHSTGMARGLGIPYYVMDCLEGETLAQRLLTQGPMPVGEVVALTFQLLDALGVAHRHGIVHRDIKPSNIFLENGRTILTDFGIAKRLDPAGGERTATGQFKGTLLYSPPEQLAGRDVTPQTDLAALGMVLYEAFTGVVWNSEVPRKAKWGGVPAGFRPLLRRALKDAPADRWADASAFRRALERTVRRPPARTRFARAALATAAVAVGVIAWPRGSVANLRIDPLRVDGATAQAYLGDSLAASVARGLSGFPDLTVLGPGQRGKARNIITGVAEVSGPTLLVTMRLRDRPFAVTTAIADWRAAADQLADSLLLRVFSSTALDSQLPSRVLPRSPAGILAFLAAEKLFRAAHWPEAWAAYDRATAVDSTCWLCWWRRGETRRWLGLDADTEALRHSLSHIALFPPQYQSLIRVDTLMLLARFDTLHELQNRFPKFLFGVFRYGDELMHRGALIGRDPAEAAKYLRQALNIRSDFAPAIEHMLWLALLVDDSTRAQAAYADMMRTATPQQRSSGIPELLQTAYAWRFSPPDMAEALTSQMIAAARQKGVAALDVGARYMNGFSLPHGELGIAHALEDDARYRRSALVAQAFGELALGRPDSAQPRFRRLQAEFPDPGNALIGLELDALRVLLEGDAAADRAHDLAAALAGLGEQNVPQGLKVRATWLARVLQCRFFGSEAVWAPVSRPVDAPPMLEQVVQACDLARVGHPENALKATAHFTDLPAPEVSDYPAYRAAVYALRAEWWHRLGRDAQAADALLWVENFDEATLPTGDPQPMEIDWVLRPLARWHRARLLASASQRDELCSLYASLRRSWSEGEGTFAARADSAARLADALGCAPSSS